MLNERCRAFVQKKETEFKAQAEEYLKKESLVRNSMLLMRMIGKRLQLLQEREL